MTQSTAIQPKGEIRIDPWQPAAEVAQALGWSLVLFSYPGAGKTTFRATPKSLILDFEGGSEVLADRRDVMVWPRRDPRTGKVPKISWRDFEQVNTQLKSRLAQGTLPFEVICFDTLSAMQRLTLEQVMASTGTNPSQPEWGKSNELLLQVVRDWCALSRETGINVVFNCHAQEVIDDSTKSVLIRMALTPGVISGINQAVSAIGYLSASKPDARTKEVQRALLLHQTTKVLAKFRQPRTGPQLPSEIPNPSLAQILEHRKKALTALNQDSDQRGN